MFSFFVLFFHASYPIFPILRVLCSERFFFSRFWADQIGNQKLLSPVKSLFVNACPILFACRRKKSDTKFQRASHNLFSIISLYPLLPTNHISSAFRCSSQRIPPIFFPRASLSWVLGFRSLAHRFCGFWISGPLFACVCLCFFPAR